MMIIEIFFRPILMVFGMIGAILLLSLSTYIFNDLYNFAWAVDDAEQAMWRFIMPSHWLSGFAYIGIYVTTMYAIANMCFKMIDDVPQQVISWMGGGAGYNMGGPDAVQSGAEKGLSGAAERVKTAQGGMDEQRAKAREAATNETDSLDEHMQRANELEQTHGRDKADAFLAKAGIKREISKDKKTGESYETGKGQRMSSAEHQDALRDSGSTQKPEGGGDTGGGDTGGGDTGGGDTGGGDTGGNETQTLATPIPQQPDVGGDAGGDAGGNTDGGN